jgi:hypothetical protein
VGHHSFVMAKEAARRRFRHGRPRSKANAATSASEGSEDKCPFCGNAIRR